MKRRFASSDPVSFSSPRNRRQADDFFFDLMGAGEAVEYAEANPATTDPVPTVSPNNRIFEFYATTINANDPLAFRVSLGEQAAQMLMKLVGLGIDDKPPGRCDAYVDAVAWNESPNYRRGLRACPSNCANSSCGLLVRSLWRLLGVRNPLIDPPYDVPGKIGTVMANLKKLPSKNPQLPAYIPIMSRAGFDAAKVTKGDAIFIDKNGSHGHVFTVVDVDRDGDKLTITSVDGGQSNLGKDDKNDGGCCGIRIRNRTLLPRSLRMTSPELREDRTITGVVKLERLKFTAPLIDIVRPRASMPASSGRSEAEAFDHEQVEARFDWVSRREAYEADLFFEALTGRSSRGYPTRLGNTPSRWRIRPETETWMRPVWEEGSSDLLNEGYGLPQDDEEAWLDFSAEFIEPDASPNGADAPFAPQLSGAGYWPVVTTDPNARTVSYRTASGAWIGVLGRSFGADRSNGTRYHLGVDLFGRFGDTVVAIEDGRILAFFRFCCEPNFTSWALLVQHAQVVVNYGEVAPDSLRLNGLAVGSNVTAGQVIGRVGRNPGGSSMIHFETYTLGTTRNYRWLKGQARPVRLLNPTRLLLQLQEQGSPRPTGGSGVTPAARSPHEVYPESLRSDATEADDLRSWPPLTALPDNIVDQIVVNRSRVRSRESEIKLAPAGYFALGQNISPAVVCSQEEDENPRLKEIITRLNVELSGEGRTSSVMTGDNAGFTWGRGLAHGGSLEDWVNDWFTASPQARDALLDLGITLTGTTWKIVDTASRTVKSGEEAIALINGREPAGTKKLLLSIFMNIAEQFGVEAANAQWKVTKRRFFYDKVVGPPKEIIDNPRAWSAKAICYVIHCAMWGKFAGWRRFKATGGDSKKILRLEVDYTRFYEQKGNFILVPPAFGKHGTISPSATMLLNMGARYMIDDHIVESLSSLASAQQGDVIFQMSRAASRQEFYVLRGVPVIYDPQEEMMDEILSVHHFNMSHLLEYFEKKVRDKGGRNKGYTRLKAMRDFYASDQNRRREAVGPRPRIAMDAVLHRGEGASSRWIVTECQNAKLPPDQVELIKRKIGLPE